MGITTGDAHADRATVDEFGEYMGGYHEDVEPNVPVLQDEPLPEDGTIELGDEPGFGVELDRDEIVSFDQ